MKHVKKSNFTATGKTIGFKEFIKKNKPANKKFSS